MSSVADSKKYIKRRIILPFVNNNIGGMHYSVLELACFLRNIGFEVQFIFFSEKGGFSCVLRDFGFSTLNFRSVTLDEIRPFSIVRTPFSFVKKLIQVFEIFKKFGVDSNDIILCNCVRSGSVIGILKALRLVRSKYIYYSRTYIRFRHNIAPFFVFADQIFCISKASRPILLSWKTEFAPILFSVCCLIKQKKIDLSVKNYALYLGRVVETKRVDLLVNEFLASSFYVNGGSLVICSNDNSIRLAELAEQNGSRIFFHTSADKQKLLSQAAFVVSRSNDEGFGRVAIEAALAGKISVFSDCWGHRSAVNWGVNGYLVPDSVNLFDWTGNGRSIPERACREYGYGWIETAMDEWATIARKHLS